MRFLFILLCVMPIVVSAQMPTESGQPIVHWNDQDTVAVQKWNVLEISLKGPKRGNPFRDVNVSATFTTGTLSQTVGGFYDDKGIYKIRFMPQQQGLWHFTTSSNEKDLDNVTGLFHCVLPDSKNHGPVHVNDTFHFSYTDGSPFWPVGTTMYTWIHQPETRIKQTLETLSTSPFNKVRMLVFPMYMAEYSSKEPQRYPFPRSRKGENDFSEFNVDFFQHLEQCVINLMNLGIQADIILFHPRDKWGYADMNDNQDDFYLSYIVRRLSAFRNVWWTIGLDSDQMLSKSTQDWDRFFRTVYENDPYDHLRSIMNDKKLYDFSLPWVSHVTVAGTDFKRAAEWRQTYQKPVLYEMAQYEGNIILEWGRISAEEMVNRIWKGVVNGAYVTHGESIKDPQNEWMWWSTGGVLEGKSPERIAFLKKIMQDFPHGLQPIAENIGGIPGEYYLYYFGESKPTSKVFELPPYREYSVELIDVWNQTITPIDSTFAETFELKLPGKSYMAVRIRKKGLLFPAESVNIQSNGTLFLKEMKVSLRHPRHNKIYYTLDGTPPNQQSTLYTSPLVFTADTTVLRTISYSDDGYPSKMVSKTFYKSNPKAALNVGKVKKGVLYDFYFGLWEQLPDFSDVRIGTSGITKTFDLSVREQQDAFGLVFKSYIKAPVTDVYTFISDSDDGSKIYLDEQLVVDNDGRHSATRKSGQIGLKEGFHKIRVEYFEAGGPETLKVSWACLGEIDEEEIPAKVLFIEK